MISLKAPLVAIGNALLLCLVLPMLVCRFLWRILYASMIVAPLLVGFFALAPLFFLACAVLPKGGLGGKDGEKKGSAGKRRRRSSVKTKQAVKKRAETSSGSDSGSDSDQLLRRASWEESSSAVKHNPRRLEQPASRNSFGNSNAASPSSNAAAASPNSNAPAPPPASASPNDRSAVQPVGSQQNVNNNQTSNATPGKATTPLQISNLNIGVFFGWCRDPNDAEALTNGKQKTHRYCLTCYQKEPVQACDFKNRHGKGAPGVFASSNTTAMREHYKTHLQSAASDCHSEHGGGTSGATLRERICWFWVDLKLSFRSVARLSVVNLLGSVFQAASLTMERRALKKEVKILHGTLNEEYKKALNERTVLLLADGGTIQKKSFLNFCVAICEPREDLNATPVPSKIFFHSSKQVDAFDSITIQTEMNIVIEELRAAGAFVAGVVTDNASAMLKATNRWRTTETQASGSDSDSETDDEANEGEWEPVAIQIDESWQKGHFFIPVSCFTHSFQLLFKDMRAVNPQIDKAFAVSERIGAAFASRTVRAKYRRACAGRFKSQSVHRPTETRWNSHLKMMVTILQRHNEINTALMSSTVKQSEWNSRFVQAGKFPPITQDEIQAVQIATLVLAPVSWSTDISQCDSATFHKVNTLFSLIRDSIGFLDRIQWDDAAMSTGIKTACRDLRKCLAEREKTNFRTDLHRIFDFFTPSMPKDVDALEREWVIDRMVEFFKDSKVSQERAAISAEIRQFRNRKDAERQMPSEDYWQSKKSTAQFSLIISFLAQVQSFVMTEAAVERSFGQQCLHFTAIRNRLDSKTLNCLLFTAINFPKLRGIEEPQPQAPPKKPEDRSHTISKAAWHACIDRLSQTSAPPASAVGPQLRSGSRLQFQRLQIVEVQFQTGTTPNGNPVFQWLKGAIMGQWVGEKGVELNKWKIAYEHLEEGEEEIQCFDPLDKDKVWRMARKSVSRDVERRDQKRADSLSANVGNGDKGESDDPNNPK